MTAAKVSARATEMLATIDATPVVIQEADGNPATIPLGDLCCVCVERRHDGDDYLCARCREESLLFLNGKSGGFGA